MKALFKFVATVAFLVIGGGLLVVCTQRLSEKESLE